MRKKEEKVKLRSKYNFKIVKDKPHSIFYRPKFWGILIIGIILIAAFIFLVPNLKQTFVGKAETIPVQHCPSCGSGDYVSGKCLCVNEEFIECNSNQAKTNPIQYGNYLCDGSKWHTCNKEKDNTLVSGFGEYLCYEQKWNLCNQQQNVGLGAKIGSKLNYVCDGIKWVSKSIIVINNNQNLAQYKIISDKNIFGDKNKNGCLDANEYNDFKYEFKKGLLFGITDSNYNDLKYQFKNNLNNIVCP